MAMFFNILDRIAENKRLPAKIRFFAYDMQKSMSTDVQKIDALLSDERFDEASAIVSAMPESHLSSAMSGRISGARMHVHDKKVRAEHEARRLVEKKEEARAALRAEAKIDPHPVDRGMSDAIKRSLARDKVDDLEQER